VNGHVSSEPGVSYVLVTPSSKFDLISETIDLEAITGNVNILLNIL